MYKRSIIFFMTLFLLFSCQKKSQGLKNSDIPVLVNQFLAMHVAYNQLNDELSQRTLNNYINALDYGKYYFYTKDINEFNRHKDRIDDYIIEKKYDIIYSIYDVYKKRFQENMKLFDTLIALDYDFQKDDTIIVDRDKVSFSKDQSDMKIRWKKNIKLQLLNYMTAGKDVKESKNKLKTKYRLLQKRINETSNKEILSRFINAFSTALDPHSNYLTQDEHEDFKISMELKLEGIGVRLRSEDGFVVVESIIPGGATDKLPEDIKLKPNDKIVAVAQKNGEPVDVIDMDLRDVVKKIRGRKGTVVKLTIIRDVANGSKQQRMIVPITREEIRLQDSDAESEIIQIDNTRPKIGYIKLPSFYHDPARRKSSAGDIKEHIKKMSGQNIKAVVLDLRGNPGGLLNEAIEIAGLFIDSGPIVQIKEVGRPAHVIYDEDGGILYSGPLVVLINKFSASASEILAGAIKDYKRGLVIGPENSFGKGTVQSYNELPFDKGAIKITTHIFYQPGGTSNQLHGITPDIIVPDLSTIWDIGEDKTRYPLKWEKIKSTSFTKYRYVNNSVVSSLKAKSKSRVSISKTFQDLLKKIEKYKVQLNDKVMSLKEESAIEEQKKNEMEKNLKKNTDDTVIDLENDLFLREALNITGDYINMFGK